MDESVRVRPADGLRPYIARYSGYRQAGVEPARHRGMPSPYLTLIFTLDDPLTIERHPDSRQPPGDYWSLIGGLHTSPALVTHAGRQSGVQVALSPLGSRALLGLPAGELAGLDLDATELLGGLTAEIRERMLLAASWRDRFAAVDRVLLRRLRAARAPGTAAVRPEVRYAWRELLRTGGATAVTDLAARSGWSDRYLRAGFRTEIGLGPKAAARVIRFDRARRRLLRRIADGTRPPLADLAAECGYADQAHLAREFRDLAGCPPRQWLEEETGRVFRNVQASQAPAWQARQHDR